MRKTTFSLTLIFILSFLFSVHADTIHYENIEIEKIDVIAESLPTGAHFDPDSVTRRMKTRAGGQFSHIDFDADLKALSQDFDRIVPKLETLNNRVYITLRVWPKPIIRTIQWEGNDRMDSADLQKELGIVPGAVFDRQAFNKAFHKLKTYYVKKGFFEAELGYNVNLDKDTSEVDIVVCVKEGRAGKIKKIVFCGFTQEEESAISDMILTKKYNIFLSWFNNEGIYHEEMVQQDQFVILNYIQNKGFADARVHISVEEASQCDRIYLTISLERGEPYCFGDITFEDNTLFCDEELMALLKFKPGDPYSPDVLRESVKVINNAYGRRGYIDTIIDFEPALSDDGCVYNVNFSFDEGKNYCVGLIKVFGNCSTETNVILHETLLVPGELFNADKLQRTEQRLRNIGYFKNVNVYAVKSEGPCGLGGNYRDVHIEVEETNTGYFSTQAGFSSADALFGGVSITEKNFNHKGLTKFWREGYGALRGGGEYAHINATIGTKSRKYELGWTKPYFMDTQWAVGFDLEKSQTRYIAHDYDINAQGVNFHATLQNNPFLRTGWHYRIRDSHVDIADYDIEKHKDHIASDQKDADGNPIGLTEEQAKTNKANWEKEQQKIKNLRKLDGLVSAAGVTLSYDSTNHPVCPTKGVRSRLMAEMAGLGGEYQFFALGFTNAYYHLCNPKTIFRVRGDMRFLVPYGHTKRDQIPLDEHLFLGGDNQVRGYRNYRLGPQINEDDPTGGNSLQYFTAEIDHALMKRVNLFVFFDAGALTNRLWSVGRIYLSTGWGVRLQLLDSIPPVTLGFGLPINEKDHSDVQMFFFQMGGRF